jgi:hypothetical protein
MLMLSRGVLVMVALLNLSLTGTETERALAMAQWPHTDAERVQFHDPYLTAVGANLSPLSATPSVIQIDVTTELRRLELMAEEHVRAGEWFGRGGSADVDAAMKTWRDVVAIEAHLQLQGGCSAAVDASSCTPVVPPTDISIDGVASVRAQPALRPLWYARSGTSPLPLGNVAEAKFAATAIGKSRRTVHVIVEGRELAHAVIDFAALE